MLGLLIVVVLLSIGIYYGILHWPQRAPRARFESEPNSLSSEGRITQGSDFKSDP